MFSEPAAPRSNGEVAEAPFEARDGGENSFPGVPRLIIQR